MADELEQVLADIKAGKAKPLYLVHGEEFLARRAAEAICEALVPPGNRDFNFTQLDGAVGGREIAQNIDTVPMFRGTKAVFVEGADVLVAKRDLDKEMNRARELWAQSSRKKDAARRVLSVVAPAGWTWRELDPEAPDAPTKTRWKKEVGWEPSADDKAFLHELAAFCRDLDMKAPRDDAQALLRAVTEGPPAGNHLVLLCEAIEAAHPLVKVFKDKGLLLKRGVERTGKGRGIESLDIDGLVAEVLEPQGKKLSPGAKRLLKDRVGEAMRQMASELEKLALYVGDRPTIEERDVDVLVAPLREEEYFELGNALGDGDAAKTLKLLHDELGRGKHPLMILGGMVSQIRKLAVDAARYSAVPGALAGRELSSRDFEATVFKRYLEHCAGRPPHPYAAWLGYKRVRKHGVKKLMRALVLGAEIDRSLKRGGRGELELERLVLAFCA